MLGLSAILAGLSGLASAAAPAYWWYMGLRLCSGMAAASMTLAARALAIEPIGPTWRGMAGVASCFLSILGGLVTILIAFLVSQLYTCLSPVATALAFSEKVAQIIVTFIEGKYSVDC